MKRVLTLFLALAFMAMLGSCRIGFGFGKKHPHHHPHPHHKDHPVHDKHPGKAKGHHKDHPVFDKHPGKGKGKKKKKHPHDD